ncbi:hypothetical protein STRIP9103_09524 [Streptomyces ipomoeae 91-03]|uniref:Uncharacterized protein n=1 Tax=Streptomyces ipomoeae 91-03 TaxID=698759 RepID=L1L548_9ACTN|nr:hypothetical protein STRIP9103_09524 [Streptomyces ipomoeae 91-03]
MVVAAEGVPQVKPAPFEPGRAGKRPTRSTWQCRASCRGRTTSAPWTSMDSLALCGLDDLLLLDSAENVR